MSPNLFARAVRRTVLMYNCQVPKPPLELTEEALRAQMSSMRFHASDNFSTYPVLYLPPDYAMGTEPVVLQSGQHRAAALLQLFCSNSDFSGYNKDLFTPKTVSVRGVGLIYNCR
jgi:hypothetical protein